MPIFSKKLSFALLALTLSQTSFASTGKFSLNGSIIGAGVEYSHTVNDGIAIRGGILGSLPLDFNFVGAGIDYNAKLTVQNYYLLGDYFLGDTPFRASAGVMSIDTNASLTAKTFVVGDTTIPASQVKSLGGDFSISGVGPYLGFGVSKSPSSSGVGLSFDIGVTSFPTISGELSLVCADTASPICDAAQPEVDKENAQIKTKIDDLSSKFKFLPVVSTGISYSF